MKYDFADACDYVVTFVIVVIGCLATLPIWIVVGLIRFAFFVEEIRQRSYVSPFRARYLG